MATLVATKRRRLSLESVAGARVELWRAVFVSRLVVLAAGSVGALYMRPVPGWQAFDPQGLSTSFGAVGNVLAAAAVRWDAVAYLSVATHGYSNAKSTDWFPLYPILVRAFTPVLPFGVDRGRSGQHRRVRRRAVIDPEACTRTASGSQVADTTVLPLALAFAPWSFVFSAGYTTSLMLVLSAATFYLAHRGRFGLACLAAAAGCLGDPRRRDPAGRATGGDLLEAPWEDARSAPPVVA